MTQSPSEERPGPSEERPVRESPVKKLPGTSGSGLMNLQEMGVFWYSGVERTAAKHLPPKPEELFLALWCKLSQDNE